MSPVSNIESDQWVSRFGDVLFLHVAFLSGSLLFYGVYAILLCFAIHILSSNEGFSKPKAGVLAAILLMFAMSTFFVGVQAAYVFVGLKMVLMDGDGNALDAFKARMAVPFVVDSVLCFLDILIGDSLVIWRTWVLWSGKFMILMVPFILHLGTIAITFTIWACEGEHMSLINLAMDFPQCIPFNRAAYVLSGATNVAATIAIGYKVWLHHRVVRKYLAQMGGRTEKVLGLVLLFTAVYTSVTILGLVVVIPFGDATNSLPLQFLNYWIRGSGRHIVGIYPTLLIVVAHLQSNVEQRLASSTNIERRPGPE